METNTTTLPFNSHVAEYEEWFEKHPEVFKTEVEAIRLLIPKGDHIKGLEIGVATGRFARELQIHDGVEPADNMRTLALRRGIYAVDAVAENLPYRGLSFDFVLMNFCVSYFTDPDAAFTEAWRVLKYGGVLIVGFLDRYGAVAQQYERKRETSTFYQLAKFYSSEEITAKLTAAGFNTLEFSQTLFHAPENLKVAELPEPGYGKGSYILVKATKPLHFDGNQQT
ncbi:MAG TPA: class I SAM-dependent methyltransferase [Chitinophagaceae bacterium]